MVLVNCKKVGCHWRPVGAIAFRGARPLIILKCAWCGAQRQVKPPDRPRFLRQQGGMILILESDGTFTTLP
jgi:hypothetical protein